VYAYQEWGSTKQNYEKMNQIELPMEFNEPKKWVSMVIPSYNTKHVFIVECLNSIKIQEGYFGIELIWINDGSDDLNTTLLERELEKFGKSTRFVKLIYKKMEKNRGIVACLNAGLALCSHDIVFRMDSDDIMDPQRIQIQFDFMEKNPAAILCGSNVMLFETVKGEKKIKGNTNHPAVLKWEDFKKTPSHWFMNHPTLCFRKKEILSIGGYDETIKPWEDFHLEVRVLKQYGAIYNIEKPLLFYRIHENQITYQGKGSTKENVEQRTRFLEDMCK
jgi:glycosyltransferase involved in cell wall biosynthesis